MATVGFQLAAPARGSGGDFPLTVEKAIATGYAENEGALLTIDPATGNFIACAADPPQIAAVAQTPGGADASGFIIYGRREYPPLTMQGILIGVGVRFQAPFLGVLPTVVDGTTFGVTRDVDGTWKVDFGKPDKGVLTYLGNIVRSPADAAGVNQNQLVLVEFLPGVVQTVP